MYSNKKFQNKLKLVENKHEQRDDQYVELANKWTVF